MGITQDCPCLWAWFNTIIYFLLKQMHYVPFSPSCLSALSCGYRQKLWKVQVLNLKMPLSAFWNPQSYFLKVAFYFGINSFVSKILASFVSSDMICIIIFTERYVIRNRWRHKSRWILISKQGAVFSDTTRQTKIELLRHSTTLIKNSDFPVPFTNRKVMSKKSM